MTVDDFLFLVGQRFRKCFDLLEKSKNVEYTRNDDKLYNFKRAGVMFSVSPERALLGMLAKHLVSILDMVDDAEKDRIPSDHLIDEKFTDVINYFLLLEALIKERRKTN